LFLNITALLKEKQEIGGQTPGSKQWWCVFFVTE
jgi:hypothetical protein